MALLWLYKISILELLYLSRSQSKMSRMNMHKNCGNAQPGITAPYREN